MKNAPRRRAASPSPAWAMLALPALLGAILAALSAATSAGEAERPPPAAETKAPPPAATAEPPKAEAPKPQPPAAEPKLVLAQWQSLYHSGRKVGYVAQSLYELSGGARRLQTNLFLRQTATAERFGYYKMITADVDAKFRPLALECRVGAGERTWLVKGHVADGELVLTRTVGEASHSARLPLEEDVTFLAWALPATLLGGAKAGETRRWLVVDESIGALLPDPCQVHVFGPRRIMAGATGSSIEGTAVTWVCGPEQVAHLAEGSGRILRSVWQSTPMVADGTSLSEARRLTGSAADGPRGVEVEGLAADGYRSPRLGLGLWIPPYPCVAHIASEAGIVKITDLTDEVSVLVRPASGPRPPAAGPLPSAEAGRQADLIQREWAARFDEVKVVPRAAAGPQGAAPPPSREVRTVEGTARLGCTTFHFRNLFVPGDGLPWFVSVTVADRPVTAKRMLLENVAGAVKAGAPEGQLPVQVSGDVIRSPYYGFEMARPNGRWRIPAHLDGPVTALEMARDDRAAVAIVRVFAPRPGQTLDAFVAAQAQAAADNLGVARPEPRPGTLGDREAVEIAYEGPKILSGAPARCTAVYTPLGSRIFALVLVVAADADETAAKDADQIRRSVKFAAPAASN